MPLTTRPRRRNFSGKNMNRWGLGYNGSKMFMGLTIWNWDSLIMSVLWFQLCVGTLSAIMKVLKRRHKLVEIDPYKLSGMTRPHDPGSVTAGDRPDNIYFHYNSGDKPYASQQAWDSCVLIEKTHWGYYCWPRLVSLSNWCFHFQIIAFALHFFFFFKILFSFSTYTVSYRLFWNYVAVCVLLRVPLNSFSQTAIIAAVSIRAEVTAQVDYVISILGQFELFVQIKLSEKDVAGA